MSIFNSVASFHWYGKIKHLIDKTHNQERNISAMISENDAYTINLYERTKVGTPGLVSSLEIKGRPILITSKLNTLLEKE